MKSPVSTCSVSPISLGSSFRPDFPVAHLPHIAQAHYLEDSQADYPVGYEHKSTQPSNTPNQEQIIRELLDQASLSGYALTHVQLGQRPLLGGNTAETVGLLSMTAPFVFKIDARQRSLIDEATAIKVIKSDHRLSKIYRDAWPVVYAFRRESPFAYLMEYFPKESGWVSLEDRLYGLVPTTHETALSMMNSVLEVMSAGIQSSVCHRHHPCLWEIYVTRIQQRLVLAEKLNPWFHGGPRLINGVHYIGWRDCIETLAKRRTKLQQLSPSFTTVVHGDANPGNILLRTADQKQWEMKLIDPKDWLTGDYLFDLCKITHFLSGTGPVEKLGALHMDEVSSEICYEIPTTNWQEASVGRCLNLAEAVAIKYGDEHWKARYELVMAANLLGLPAGRLGKERTSSAKILFCEGLKWLIAFCQNSCFSAKD